MRSLMKSALPRAMNVVQEGRRFKLQQRDYSVISETSWKSAVSDTFWLSKKNGHKIPNSRLMHFIPNFDGSSGFPFENEVNRYRANKPDGLIISTKEMPTNISVLQMDNLRTLLVSPFDLKPKPVIISKSKVESQYGDKQSNINCLQQMEWEKPLPTSIGVDDEALNFSTNFVLMAFLFLMVVLLKDI